MPVFILLAISIVMVVFVLPSLLSSGTSDERERYAAVVCKTTHDLHTGRNGEIKNSYAVTVLLNDTSKRVEEHRINRKDYGLLYDGAEIFVTPKSDGYAKCTLK